MTEELKKEANKYADDYATPDLDCSFRAYMFEASKEGYLAGAEPREKQIDELKAQTKVLEQNLEDTEICENGLKNRIAELEDKLANADYQIEGRDNEIRELEKEIENYKLSEIEAKEIMVEQEEQIEKMKSDVTEEIGFAKNFNELHTYSVLSNLLNKWEINK